MLARAGQLAHRQASTDVADELRGAQWHQAVDMRGLQNAMAQRGLE